MITYIKSPRFIVLTVLIIAAACTRAFPLFISDSWHFTAVGALAIFAGAKFDKRLAFIMPLAAMALSDLFIGNGFSVVVYAGFAAMVLCGFAIRRKQNPLNIGMASVMSAVVFFLITNFAFFYPVTAYPHNIGGIISAYVAGLPFINNMIAGNLVFSAVLFGAVSLLERRYPVLAK
jgi:hypothetical protein